MFRAVLLTLLFVSAKVNAEPYTQHHGVILQYHHISTSTPAVTSISPEGFKQHLDLLDELKINVVSLDHLITNIRNGIGFRQPVAAITFDDGYESIYLNAFPELRRRNLPFTVFINPLAIDQKRSDQMTWEQLKELTQHGAIIANHTQYHNHLLARLENETDAQWRSRTQQDIHEAQGRLEEEIEGAPKWLAYPYGEFDHKLQSLLIEMGFLGFSQQSGGINKSTDWQAIPRFPASGIYSNPKTLAVKLTSRPFDVIHSSPKPTLRLLQDSAPTLTLTIDPKDVGIHGIQCYYSGNPIDTEVSNVSEGVIIQTKISGKLPLGRSRYNCTAPSNKSGQYFWYSMPFITTNNNGDWVD